jgi:hypothetical protein
MVPVKVGEIPLKYRFGVNQLFLLVPQFFACVRLGLAKPLFEAS